jgi:hypothetical protein
MAGGHGYLDPPHGESRKPDYIKRTDEMTAPRRLLTDCHARPSGLSQKRDNPRANIGEDPLVDSMSMAGRRY